MAIAKVIKVTNSCFIEGSPASSGQMINYGDVIETYDISKGLEESFKSKSIEDDGYLNITFLDKGESMSIKPHCKVIFESGGAWAGANTVLLDSNSEYVTLDKPKSKKIKAVGIVTKVKMANVNGLEVRPGEKLYYGDVIKTGENGYFIFVWTQDKQMQKIRKSQTFTLIDHTVRSVKKAFLAGPNEHPQGFLIQVPIHVASIKG